MVENVRQSSDVDFSLMQIIKEGILQKVPADVNKINKTIKQKWNYPRHINIKLPPVKVAQIFS